MPFNFASESIKKLAEEAAQHEEMARNIRNYRDIVNFNYWRLRAQVEQTEEAINARKFIYQGDQAYQNGYLTDARDNYEEGLKLWREVLDKFPALVEDNITGSDLMDIVKKYRKIYNQLDKSFPEAFILQDILDKYEPKPQ